MAQCYFSVTRAGFNGSSQDAESVSEAVIQMAYVGLLRLADHSRRKLRKAIRFRNCRYRGLPSVSVCDRAGAQVAHVRDKVSGHDQQCGNEEKNEIHGVLLCRVRSTRGVGAQVWVCAALILILFMG